MSYKLYLAIILPALLISTTYAYGQETVFSTILKQCKQYNTMHIYAGLKPGFNITDLQAANVHCYDMPKLYDHGWQVVGFIIDNDTSEQVGKIYHKPNPEVKP